MVLLGSVLWTIHIGSTEIPIKEVFEICIGSVFYGGEGLKAGNGPYLIFRLYGISGCQMFLVRFFFGGAGSFCLRRAMQALVLNPVGDPYILGISSGASAGAACALLLPISLLSGPFQTTAAAFLGALLSAGTVYFMAKTAGGGMIRPVPYLSGTAVNAVMSAVTSFVIFLAKAGEYCCCI